MLLSVITLLIQICFLAIAIYLIIWVLGVVGIEIPAKVVQILWVIVVLIAIYLIVQFLGGQHVGGGRLFGHISNIPLLSQG